MFKYQTGGGLKEWQEHVKSVKTQHPTWTHKQAVEEAKQTYKPTTKPKEKKPHPGPGKYNPADRYSSKKRPGRIVEDAMGLYQMGYGYGKKSARKSGQRGGAAESPMLKEARRVLKEYYAQRGTLNGVHSAVQEGGARRSAKRASPKRKSAKRASPKRKSAKRASPKRKSPKRKSAKRASPKRKSPKRMARKSPLAFLGF